MISLIKCHIHYMFSKATFYLITLTSLLTLVMIFIYAYSANSLDGDVSKYYFESCYSIINTILLLITIFMFAHQFQSRQDQYSQIIVGCKVSKWKYCTTKIFVVLFSITIVYVIYCTLVIAVFLILINDQLIEIAWIIKYANIYLELLYYGFLSMLLMQFVDNLYMIFVVFGIYLFGASSNSTLVMLITCRTNQYGMYQFSYLYVIIIILLCFSLNVVVFSKKDIK